MSNSRSVSVKTGPVAQRGTGGAPAEHVVGMTPAVMLSPKARNLVALSLGGATTAIRKLQVEACCAASRAVHATSVAPTSNDEPLCRVHVVVTGGVPPVATGAAKRIATALPSGDCTVWGAGQAIVSALRVGPVGLSPHPAAVNPISAAAHVCQCLRLVGII
jgi:hypothetical protein